MQPHAVLITGGCGFIGSNFINYVFDRWPSTSFVNIDKLEFGASEENVELKVTKSERYKFVRGTVQDLELLLSTLREHEVDTVIHFAAITHVDESYSDRVGTIAQNVLSTTTLLEAVTFHYPNLRRLVHISTDEVYGDSMNDIIPKNEKSLLNPTNPYAASKGACELILNAYWHSYKVPYVMVRMNNVYGPRQARSKLIPKFTTLAIEGKPYPLMGDGQHTRSWMYVDDCAEAILKVTENGRLGETYNIGTDFEKRNYDLTLQIHDIVAKLLNRKKSSPQFRHIPDRPYHDRRYYIDFSKINSEMNWRCTTDFSVGLAKTIEYYVKEYKKNAEREDEGTRLQG
uniref:dTDP-D-glucose 4,6-dehydratase n=1 Tax=Parascaris univalens TaxID=6257 RepID=A0A915BAU8_PARUN